MQRGRFGARGRAHAEIHQPGLQRGLIDPLADFGVMRVRHQQRQTKIVQQPLGGAFPVALVVAHLQQFAREGQAFFRQF